ncbi:MAG: pyridoxamine 5'-phosphate oxidase [Halieaceae bacterium]|jgi:pyridoxamine 5'-phosphate oxidase|nr:pyridoxamine 5'-phosphate oxidase [Halieaceae bacterium]
MNYEDYRRNYTQGGLHRDMLSDCPLTQFDRWQQQALAAELADPTAASLATLEPDGRLWQRIVLLKSVSGGGFVFFTNYDSAKGQALAADPRASMLFPWTDLERQVIVSGSVEKVSDQESADYFSSRPRESQLGAWTSQQSQPIDSREALMSRFEAAKEQFADQDVPRPPHWGGFRLMPTRIEFWQGGEHRLHDRFVYHLEGGHWVITRLQP